MLFKYYLLLPVLFFSSVWSWSTQGDPPAPPELSYSEVVEFDPVVNVSTTSTIPSTTASTTSTIPPATTVPETTTTVSGFDDAECPEIWDVALSVGWKQEWLPLLDKIVIAESQCTESIVSRTKDYGYTQINWSAHGSRLTANGVSREDLLVAEINLREALWIAVYAEEHYGCWSQPWYMSGKWC